MTINSEIKDSSKEINKVKIKITSNKDENKTKKTILSKNGNNGSFRNNYKNYQYDYEEDFYEP